MVKTPRPAEVPHQLRPERAAALDGGSFLSGDDGRGARRRRAGRQEGGLLHDIGKAVDHEVEGPHAAIGAEIAKKFEQSVQGRARIAAHHEEVESADLEVPRPGRRRYRRATGGPPRDAGKLHQAAGGPGEDRRSFRAWKGLCDPGGPRDAHHRPPRRSTNAAKRLARDIAKKIEEELNYPGQIKVTVIRETRAIEYAK